MDLLTETVLAICEYRGISTPPKFDEILLECAKSVSRNQIRVISLVLTSTDLESYVIELGERMVVSYNEKSIEIATNRDIVSVVSLGESGKRVTEIKLVVLASSSMNLFTPSDTDLRDYISEEMDGKSDEIQALFEQSEPEMLCKWLQKSTPQNYPKNLTATQTYTFENSQAKTLVASQTHIPTNQTLCNITTRVQRAPRSQIVLRSDLCTQNAQGKWDQEVAKLQTQCRKCKSPFVLVDIGCVINDFARETCPKCSFGNKYCQEVELLVGIRRIWFYINTTEEIPGFEKMLSIAQADSAMMGRILSKMICDAVLQITEWPIKTTDSLSFEKGCGIIVPGIHLKVPVGDNHVELKPNTISYVLFAPIAQKFVKGVSYNAAADELYFPHQWTPRCQEETFKRFWYSLIEDALIEGTGLNTQSEQKSRISQSSQCISSQRPQYKENIMQVPSTQTEKESKGITVPRMSQHRRHTVNLTSKSIRDFTTDHSNKAIGRNATDHSQRISSLISGSRRATIGGSTMFDHRRTSSARRRSDFHRVPQISSRSIPKSAIEVTERSDPIEVFSDRAAPDMSFEESLSFLSK